MHHALDVYSPRFIYFKESADDVSTVDALLCTNRSNPQEQERRGLSATERRRLMMQAGAYRLNGEEYPNSILCIRDPSPCIRPHYVPQIALQMRGLAVARHAPGSFSGKSKIGSH